MQGFERRRDEISLFKEIFWLRRDSRREGWEQETLCFSLLGCREEVGVSQVVPVVKNPPANAENIRNAGSVTGLGISPGGSDGNSF